MLDALTLDGIDQSSSTIKGVFAGPIMWSHPDDQIYKQGTF